MANIKSFPNNQDEFRGAEDVMKWLHGRTSGVFAGYSNAAVTAVQNEMAVNISDGLGWMANSGKDGVVWWIDHEAVNGTKLKLGIDAADGALNRIDRIIVEWKTTNYVDYPEVKVLKGTTSGKATAPALTNNSTVRQISLAQISVAAGTTAITPGLITDERLNPSVCGLVTESFEIDTSMINAQFEELLERLKTNLQEITEGQILDGSITVEKLAEETQDYISAVNLLYNAYWKNSSEIVNQRGKTSYSGSGFGINGWRTNYSGDTVSITSNGVKNTINSSEHGWHFHQNIEKCERLVGKTVTVAAKVATVSGSGLNLIASFRNSSDNEISSCSVVFSSGIVIASGEVPSGTVKIRVGVYAGQGVSAADYVELEWMAMCVGAFTAKTFPYCLTKGYANELLACNVAETGNVSGMVLLWKNASPKSVFAGQTVSLDLSGYDRIQIDFVLATSYTYVYNVVGNIGDTVMASYIWGDTGKFGHRSAIISKSGVQFRAASYEKAENNGYCIPYRIFGIKGGSE